MQEAEEIDIRNEFGRCELGRLEIGGWDPRVDIRANQRKGFNIAAKSTFKEIGDENSFAFDILSGTISRNAEDRFIVW